MRNIILSLLGATIFAAVDLYVVNVSSYVAGGLLVYVIAEGRTRRNGQEDQANSTVRRMRPE